VRAIEILHDRFQSGMGFLHAKRWDALWRCVLALLASKQLWLTGMGRAWPTDALKKHGIKAIDRFLGNQKIWWQRFEIARALVVSLLARPRRPIVLIDTMEIRHKVVAVTASLAHNGRSLPIWSTTIKAIRLNAKQGRRFLEELKKILPEDPRCRPILVTDGGFESAWFDDVERLGWDYVGRVRGQTKVLHRDAWLTCSDLHRMATRRPKNVGLVSYPKKKPRRRRLVLSKLPTSHHRRRQTRRGLDNDSNYKHYRKNAHEPLVLTTSLTSRAAAVVEIYKLRMQIEQSFRDLKCYRWGWSLRLCKTRSPQRLELLLLIASVATIVQQLVGIAGEGSHLARRHQANTVRRRRVLSVFFLGGLLLASADGELITERSLRDATNRLRSEISSLGQLAC
jgi:hypothetical protein